MKPRCPSARRVEELRAIPLAEVLRWAGLTVRREGQSLRARGGCHNIVATGTRWFDNKAGVGGGGAIDLLRHLTGVDFTTACRLLATEVRPIGGAEAPEIAANPSSSRDRSTHKAFVEQVARYAVRNDDAWPQGRDYLVRTRGIVAALVDELHAVGSIFTNDHRPFPSLVFLHRTPTGHVEGASLRGIRPGSPFRPCLGDKCAAWFVVGSVAAATRVVAVESPIDALSYYALSAGGTERLAVASCAGAIVPTPLLLHARDRALSFAVALDRDAAGERGWRRARAETADWAGFRLTLEQPRRKDWNEDLCAARAVHAIGRAPRAPSLHA